MKSVIHKKKNLKNDHNFNPQNNRQQIAVFSAAWKACPIDANKC